MKTTIDAILIDYLKFKVGKKVYEYEIEENLVDYGKLIFGKLHTAGSYSRRWRALRNNPQSLPFEFKLNENEKNMCWNITEKNNLKALDF